MLASNTLTCSAESSVDMPPSGSSAVFTVKSNSAVKVMDWAPVGKGLGFGVGLVVGLAEGDILGALLPNRELGAWLPTVVVVGKFAFPPIDGAGVTSERSIKD